MERNFSYKAKTGASRRLINSTQIRRGLNRALTLLLVLTFMFSTVAMAAPALAVSGESEITEPTAQAQHELAGELMRFLFSPQRTPPAAPPLEGTVTIPSEAVFGQELTANVAITSLDHGTLTYAWLRDGAPIPNANTRTLILTAADVGRTITFRVMAANFSGNVTSIAVTVERANPVVIFPTSATLTFGQNLSQATLTGQGNSGVTGTFTFDTPNARLTVAQSDNMFLMRFTPTEAAANTHNTVTEYVMVTVNRAVPTALTPPTAGAITYGQRLEESALTGGSSGGEWAWENPDEIPPMENDGFSVIFAPTDMDNYDWSGINKTFLVPVTVNAPSGGVTFREPNVSAVSSGNVNQTINFNVRINLTQAGRNSGFSTLSFEWLRNGQVWAGAGGSGTMAANQINNNTPIQLRLPAGNHAQRGGTWILRISLLNADGNALFTDQRLVTTLTIDQPQIWQPPPAPIPEPIPDPAPPPPEEPPPPADGLLVDPAGLWQLDANGNWRFELNAGGNVQGWAQIGGERYFFDENGIMQTSWLEDGDYWHYLRSNGTMATGWVRTGGSWFYLCSDDGIMQTSWVRYNGTWHYLRGSGAMATGWVEYSGEWYYLRGNGAMATGWVRWNGDWYYLRGDGAMATGWVQSGGLWYYLQADGAMISGGVRTIGNERHRFAADGRWLGRG
ncbi:MAG: hypothetical protein FWC20_12350 [Oscillospiraceae bacterium]|nr:hypothetical protein [Oscillospiraceae bacterium]MCL2280176.1 hypothetical protein [Oscillospiraceae bacterium]